MALKTQFFGKLTSSSCFAFWPYAILIQIRGSRPPAKLQTNPHAESSIESFPAPECQLPVTCVAALVPLCVLCGLRAAQLPIQCRVEISDTVSHLEVHHCEAVSLSYAAVIKEHGEAPCIFLFQLLCRLQFEAGGRGQTARHCSWGGPVLQRAHSWKKVPRLRVPNNEGDIEGSFASLLGQ